MSFDKMARELLAPLYERIQLLERDAAAMQKLVGQMALGEEKGDKRCCRCETPATLTAYLCDHCIGTNAQFSREELETLKHYVIDCAGHSSGERRERLRHVAARLNQLLS